MEPFDLFCKQSPGKDGTKFDEQSAGLELLSVECRKTKTKVNTRGIQKGRRQSSEPIKTASK